MRDTSIQTRQSWIRRVVAVMLSGMLAIGGMPTQSLAEAIEEVDVTEDEYSEEVFTAEDQSDVTADEATNEVEEAESPDTALSTQDGSELFSGVCGTCSWSISNEGSISVLTIGEGTLEGSQTGTGSWPWHDCVVYCPDPPPVDFGDDTQASVDDEVTVPDPVSTQSESYYAITTVTVVRFTGKVTACESLRGMFRDFPVLHEIEGISQLDTSATTDMSYMFSDCSSLESLDLSGWNTYAVASMDSMFDGCTSLSSLTISEQYNTSINGSIPVPTAVNEMWWSLKAGEWYTVDEISSTRNGIADTYANVSINGSVKNGVTSFGIWGTCPWEIEDGTLSVYPGVGEDNTYRNTDGIYRQHSPWSMYSQSIKTVRFVKNENGSVVAPQSCAHLLCLDQIETIDFTGFDTSATTDMYCLFSGCEALTDLDLSPFDTTNVTRMIYMFSGCSSLKTITVGEQYSFVNEVFPDATAENGKWWSVANKTWYTKDDIVANRSGIPDTYRNYSGDEPTTIDISSCSLVLDPTNYSYDGTAKEPAVTVKDEGKTLTKDTDYVVSYPNAINAGSYEVTVTGKGSYTGTATAQFTISAKKVTPTVSLSPTAFTYTGSAQKPTVTVKDGSATLTEGSDYNLEWPEGCTDAGDYTVKATLKGNREGTGEATYTIAKASLANATISSIANQSYTGSQIKPEPTVKLGDKTLKSGTDYSLSYRDNTNVGTATVVVTGKGNYKDTKSATFAIVSNYTVTYNANGGTGTPSPQAKITNVALTLSNVTPTKSYIINYNSSGGSVSPASKSLSCTFTNWNTQKNGNGISYAPGASYTANSDATLYAQWVNPMVGALATPTRNGYSFVGWFTSAAGGQQVTASTTATGNMTLYAHWIDPYNLGDETYSFHNYGDTHASGHCFGMSMTSAGYHNGLLDIRMIGGNTDTPLHSFGNTLIVKEPICRYQSIQGSYSALATVAGGSYYLKGTYNISSDWQSVVDYVKNHAYDNAGILQIGFRKSNEGGHAVNFLRYENVDGQDRLYAYDNNFPEEETYFYRDSYGRVLQAPVQTFSGSIDCIALRDSRIYFDNIGDYDASHVIYMAKDAATVQGYACTYMETGQSAGEYVMYEIPASQHVVTIIPSRDNADFIYMGTEYSFGNITDKTRGDLRFATMDEGASNSDECFTVYETGSAIPIATLSASTFAYDGQAHKPKVTVKVGGTTLRESQDYDVEYPADSISIGEHQVKVTLKGKYSGSITKSYVIAKGRQTIVASNKSVVVGKTAAIGAKTNGDGKLTYKTSDASVATISKTGVVTGKKAGIVKITITAAETANYQKVAKTVTVTVIGPNTLTAKAKQKTVKVKLSKVNKKAQKLKSNVQVTNAQGAVRYANVSSSKKAKKLKVNAKTGKITVPKGTKKGTYKIKVKVTAAGDATHEKGARTASFKVVVE